LVLGLLAPDPDLKLVNTTTAHLTVKAQVYITGTGGVAHAGWAGVLYLWDEKDVIEVSDKDVLF
jgi:hypothetical protein